MGSLYTAHLGGRRASLKQNVSRTDLFEAGHVR